MFKNKKILIIALTFILLTNYILEPVKVNAVGGTLVALYGASVAEKLLAFILCALATGVTFNAVEEAKAMFDKWQMDSNNWQPPSDGGGGNGWRDIIKQMLYGGAVAGATYEFINKIKDFFQSLGAKEGENIYGNSILSTGIENGLLYKIVFEKNAETNASIRMYVWNDNKWIYAVESYTSWALNDTLYSYKYLSHEIKQVSTNGYRFSIGANWVIYRNGKLYSDVDKNATRDLQLKPLDTDLPELEKQIIYNVTNNSYIITNIPPTTTPQPNISNIPGIKQIITPDGKVKQIYEGDTDDLIDDILENTEAEDVINETKNPVQNGRYTIYEIDTETGTVIEIVPETDELPFPDLENPEIPENELQGQGIIITLLKSIVNWLYNIWKSIQRFFEVPQDIKLDFEPLRGISLFDRFPFCLPWDFSRMISSLQSPSSPPRFETNILGVEVVYDFAQFENIAVVFRSIVSFIFVLGLIMITRKIMMGG